MMKNNGGKYVWKVSAVAFLIVSSLSIPLTNAFPSGISGSTVGNGCVCHGAGLASEDVQIDIAGLPVEWEIGEEYEIRISVESTVPESGSAFGGFNLLADGGSLSERDGTVQIQSGEATHTEVGNMQREWVISWIAPDSPTGDVEFRVYANAVDGDGAAGIGDQWSIMSVTIEGPEGEPIYLSEPGTARAVLVGLGVAIILVFILPDTGGRLDQRDEG
ncbi:MAG: hypothetical protein CMB35_04530 [Euryarchaeota archaeon]|jgi:hypothetical protein|nr:hypothetical protein [Euryarchaeota archaeon]